MAVTQALLEQLMELDARERVELAQLLLSTVEDEDDEDDLDEGERSRLHAALERSSEDIKAGRVHDAAVVIDELRARHRRDLSRPAHRRGPPALWNAVRGHGPELP